MRNTVGLIFFALAGCISAPHAQQDSRAASSASMAHAKPAPMPADLASGGLAPLEAMTFDCPKAGLNAAAREAGKVPSQGTYQFAYFSIVNDAHHAAYEVGFKSNHAEEPELRYCVSLYCQQGWDPRTTQIDVRPMSAERGDACGGHPKKKKKR
jgi:hypothetical protein